MKDAIDVTAPPDTLVSSEEFPNLLPDALYGLAGDFVRLIAPQSEANDAALLFQFLAAFGAAIGHSPHYRVEADNQHTNLFVAVIGDSAKARKGTSLGHVKRIFKLIDPTLGERTVSGLASGEGLIHHVRDGSSQLGEVLDKRLLCIESELASPLKLAARDGNILSPILRNAWDSSTLQSLTKGSPAKATDPHITVVGHCTQTELQRYLTQLEVANGLGNRILFVCARRSQLMPFGGQVDEENLKSLADSVKSALTTARSYERITLDGNAKAMWQDIYAKLSEAKPGMAGSLCARSEAQTLRLSLIYALLDTSRQIKSEHLQAGLAAWRYAEGSVMHIFGASLGNEISDRILAKLRQMGKIGVTRTQISGLFSNHLSREKLDSALGELERAGLATRSTVGTEGRPLEKWHISV